MREKLMEMLKQAGPKGVTLQDMARKLEGFDGPVSFCLTLNDMLDACLWPTVSKEGCQLLEDLIGEGVAEFGTCCSTRYENRDVLWPGIWEESFHDPEQTTTLFWLPMSLALVERTRH
jgi:hypothetical protein